MNIAALTAIRTVLGPMTSEAKCREVYEAVLLSVREPTTAMIERGLGSCIIFGNDYTPDPAEIWSEMVSEALYDGDDEIEEDEPLARVIARVRRSAD